jgi:tripartite-type tricarboxylate transporter receptor subunit TctC
MLRTILSAVAAAFILAPGSAAAQDWPGDQPIRVIVNFTPGSATDTIARVVWDQVARQTGWTVVIENRPGGGGTIGGAAVATSEPDGRTLLVSSSGHTMAPSLYAGLVYEPETDLVPVAMLAAQPLVLVAAEYESFEELVEAAKANPGAMNFSSAGVGSASHLPAERVRMAAGFEAVHVPFPGAPEALQGVVTGQAAFYTSPIAPARGMIQEGRVNPLLVTTRERSSALPEVPSIAEVGYPEAEYVFWVGLLAPDGTPETVIDRLNEEVNSAIQSAEVQERFAGIGAEQMILSVQEFDELLQREFGENADLAEMLGIEPQ